jgi:acyl-CoA thioesterase II
MPLARNGWRRPGCRRTTAEEFEEHGSDSARPDDVNEASPLLARILTLNESGERSYQGCASGQVEFGLYGGHLLGQAVAATQQTVEAERMLHSIHGYFLRGGDGQQPIEYEVELVRDGRSFCTRRAVARQGDRVLFELMASFHNPETGSGEMAEPMPTGVPGPHECPSFEECIAKVGPIFGDEWSTTPKGFETRFVHAPWAPTGPSADNGIDYWFKVTDALPDVPGIDEAVLAYVSDDSISDNTMVPFGKNWGGEGTTLASLDHSMWFHRPAKVTDWLYVRQRPINVGGNRGLSEMRVWNLKGELVTSASQEGLLRF